MSVSRAVQAQRDFRLTELHPSARWAYHGLRIAAVLSVIIGFCLLGTAISLSAQMHPLKVALFCTFLASLGLFLGCRFWINHLRRRYRR